MTASDPVDTVDAIDVTPDAEPVDGAAAAAVTGIVGDVEIDLDDAADPAKRSHGFTIDRLMIALIVLIGVRIGMSPLGDNSFFTHLSTGRIIFDTSHVPTADPYSFSANGDPWTVQSWLASVIYAGAEAIGGFAAIRVLVTALTIAILLSVWRATRPAGGILARFVPLAFVIAVATTYWSERPLIFGLLGLALVQRAADDDLDPRWLVPVLWVWVNTHGSFPFAPGLLVLLAVGRRLDGESWSVELRALRWTVIGIAVAAINPLGPKLLLFPLSMFERKEAFGYVIEWMPLKLDSWVAWAFLLQTVVALALVLARCRRWRAILPILAFAAATAMSRRNIAQASLVIAFASVAASAGLGSIRSDLRRPIFKPATIAIGAITAVLFLGALAGPNVNLRGYPVAAVEWAEDHDLISPPARVLSTDVVGGYLEARFGHDGVQVFVDDRVDMYPIEVVRDLVTLVRDGSPADYRAVLTRVEPTVIIWQSDSAFGRWLAQDGAWTVEHRAEGWLVVVPSERATA